MHHKQYSNIGGERLQKSLEGEIASPVISSSPPSVKRDHAHLLAHRVNARTVRPAERSGSRKPSLDRSDLIPQPELRTVIERDYRAMEGMILGEALERMLGLDVPVYVQYGRWIGVLPTPDWVTGESHFKGLLQGTLGQSLVGDHFPVEEKIIGRLPVTIELGVMAIVIGLVIALPVGIYSAIRQDTAADYAGRSVAIIGLATPRWASPARSSS